MMMMMIYILFINILLFFIILSIFAIHSFGGRKEGKKEGSTIEYSNIIQVFNSYEKKKKSIRVCLAIPIYRNS